MLVFFSFLVVFVGGGGGGGEVVGFFRAFLLLFQGRGLFLHRKEGFFLFFNEKTPLANNFFFLGFFPDFLGGFV